MTTRPSGPRSTPAAHSGSTSRSAPARARTKAPGSAGGPAAFDVLAHRRPFTPEPFAVRLGAREWRLKDLDSTTFEDATSSYSNLAEYLAIFVDKAERDEFRAALGELESWRVAGIAAAYVEHFKAEAEKAAAQTN